MAANQFPVLLDNFPTRKYDDDVIRPRLVDGRPFHFREHLAEIDPHEGPSQRFRWGFPRDRHEVAHLLRL